MPRPNTQINLAEVEDAARVLSFSLSVRITKADGEQVDDVWVE